MVYLRVYDNTPPLPRTRKLYKYTHTQGSSAEEAMECFKIGHKLLMHCKGMYCDIVAHSVVYAVGDKPHTQRLSDLW